MSLPYLRQAKGGYTSPGSRSSNMAVRSEDITRQNENRQRQANEFANTNNNLGTSYNAYNAGTGTVDSPVFKNVTRRVNETGNPQFLGGLSKIVLGNQTVDMPNAIGQQIMFEDSYNQGRANTADKYFGNSAITKDTPYYSYATLQDKFNKMVQVNPRLGMANTPLNRYEADRDQATRNDMRVSQLENQISQGTTERFNAQGQMIGGNNASLNRELEAAKRAQANFQGTAPNLRRGAYFEDLALNQYLGAQMRGLEGYRPTVSNLQISERVS